MKKIVIKGVRDVEIVDVPIPKPKEQELLVKTELTGVSAGTEMMLYRGTYPNFKLKKWPQWKGYPVNPGYELVGTVVEIGESDKKNEGATSQIDSLGPTSAVIKTDVSEFKIGDRVVCMGEHGEYAVVPAVLAAKVPDNVSSKEATLAILGTTAMHAIRRAKIEYGDTVAVIGCGVLGYLVMQHAKNNGARRVVVLDIDDSRLEMAKKAGADVCINPGKVDSVAELRANNNGILADVVIEASGFKGTEQQALDLVRERGRIVILGWHTENVEFLFGDFYFKETELIASQAIGPEAGLPYSYVRWTSDQSIKWSVELISCGKLTGKHFTPSVFSYKDIAKVYELIDKRDPSIGMQTILMW